MFLYPTNNHKSTGLCDVSAILSIIKEDNISSKFKRGPVAQLGRAPDFYL